MVTRDKAPNAKPEGLTGEDTKQWQILKNSTRVNEIPPSHRTEVDIVVNDKSRDAELPSRTFGPHNWATPLRHAFKSAVENPVLVDKVLDLLEQGRLSKLTPVHILAVSPVIRVRIVNY